MKPKQELYIGWQDHLPSGSRNLIRTFLVVIFGLMILIASLLVIRQNQFASSQYQIGKITEHQGYLFSLPRPTLVQVADNGDRTSILLVSYGKFGADEDLRIWYQDHPEAARGSMVKINGTTATFNGVTVLELTHKDQSIELIEADKLRERQQKKLGFTQLHGEIVDPKCFFGAMKPGEGKIHKSCAIRCLSGGIPPVLVAEDGLYYTLQFPDHVSISDISSMVAKPVRLEGNVEILDGARYMYVSESSLQTLKMPVVLDSEIAFCNVPASR